VSFAGAPEVCLITGAAGKLGSALIKALPDRSIAGLYHHTVPDVSSQLRQNGWPRPAASAPATFVVKADLSDPSSTERAVDLVLARFGYVDHLINAAADVRFLGSSQDAQFFEKDLAAQYSVNALAPLRIASMLAHKCWRETPELNRARRRSILNVSSVSGLYIYAGTGQSGYSASKAALNFLTLHMANDFSAIGVRVNAILPTSFPAIITTEDVVAALRTVTDGSANASLYIVDEDGCRLSNGG